MIECRFCSTPIDESAAGAAADKLEEINKACAAANIIKGVDIMMPVVFIISLIFLFKDQQPLEKGFVPFAMPRLSFGLFIQAFFMLGPLVIIGWQKKFKSIQTDDPDFLQAKKSMRRSLILWLVVLGSRVLIQILVKPLEV
jgi:hypothetical protein